MLLHNICGNHYNLFFFLRSLMNREYLFEIAIFCSIINVFSLTFETIIVSLLKITLTPNF